MYLRVAVIGLLALFCDRIQAQGTFTLTNTVNPLSTQVFTNSLGTAVLTNGMIVFEGQLDATNLAVAAGTDAYGQQLASVQLLVQVKLFDALPASNEVGNVQGALVALRDSPTSSNGTYFVRGSTNNVMTWIPLLQTNNSQFAVADGATNYVTFVFHYWGTSNTYQVFIGSTTALQAPSLPVTSLSSATSGITGVSLLGSGALQTYGTASGPPGPLSASIGFSVYATANGVLLVLDTVNEKGTGPIIVFAKINGEWVEVGRVLQAKGSGDNHYEIVASGGLAVGQSYLFKIQDEIGNEHVLNNEISVKAIKMDSIVFEPSTLTVTFNTEIDRSYQVVVADSPDAAVWTAAVIYYPIANQQWGYSDQPFTAAGTSTTVKIPINIGEKPKRFFKVVLQ
jgi:hypothetical protein